MSFFEWRTAHKVPFRVYGEGVYVLASEADPTMWRLSDYLVSSAVSGPGYILCPRPTPFGT